MLYLGGGGCIGLWQEFTNKFTDSGKLVHVQERLRGRLQTILEKLTFHYNPPPTPITSLISKVVGVRPPFFWVSNVTSLER